MVTLSVNQGWGMETKYKNFLLGGQQNCLGHEVWSLGATIWGLKLIYCRIFYALYNGTKIMLLSLSSEEIGSLATGWGGDGGHYNY